MSTTQLSNPRVALTTYHLLPELNVEDQRLQQLLQDRGLHTQICIWNDPAVDWSQFDAVLIRSIWDYFQHYAEYLKWLDQLQTLGVPTLNPSQVLRWNSDKRYLRDMAQAGVRIAQTDWLRGEQIAAHLGTLDGTGEWVVKPAVSGGAWHTLRGRAGDAEFLAAVAQLPAQMEFLLQPFLPEIASAGEWSLLFFGGQFSHAVLKTPAAGDYRVQAQFGGKTECLEPPASVLAAAQLALDATRKLLDTQLTYARVDGVVVAGEFVLMELELIEPFLFLEYREQSTQLMADAVVQALQDRS